MSIFKRRDEIDTDNLPGREAMPRSTLPEFDAAMERVVQDRLNRPKAKPSIPERRERLDAIMGDFAHHHDMARKAAQDYITEHAALIEDAAAEKAELQARMEHLDKIASSMPKIGGQDEKDPNDDSRPERFAPEQPAGDGKIQSRGLGQLSIADRRPKPIQT